MQSYSSKGLTSSTDSRHRKHQGFVLISLDGFFYSFVAGCLPYYLASLLGDGNETWVLFHNAAYGIAFAVARSFCISRIETRGRFRMKMVNLALGINALAVLLFGCVQRVLFLFCVRTIMGWFSGMIYCHGKRRLHATKEYSAWYAGLLIGFSLSCGLYDSSMTHSTLLSCLAAVVFLILAYMALLQPKPLILFADGWSACWDRLAAALPGSSTDDGFAALGDPEGGVPLPAAAAAAAAGGPAAGGAALPDRYIRGCDGDLEEARRRWALTLRWRREQNVDGILDEPQPYFFVIKKYYPHFTYKRGRNGCVTYYEQVGRADIEAMRARGVTIAALVRHYVFVSEFLWRRIEADDDAQAITIMDIEGCGFSQFKGDTKEFFQQCSSVIQSHYVERSNKIFVINAPGWFNMIWKVVRPMLHENTQRKISICGKGRYEELLAYVGPENVPAEYGGTCRDAFYNSELEKPMHDFVREKNQASPLGLYTGEGDDEMKQGGGSAQSSADDSFVSAPEWMDQAIQQQRSVDIIEEEFGTRPEETRKARPPAPALARARTDDSQLSTDSNGGGLWGRVLRPFRRGRAPVAHLGSSANAFYYDTERREWVVTGTPSQPQHRKTPRDSEEDEATVLAIQAAHGVRRAAAAAAAASAASAAAGGAAAEEETAGAFVNAFPFAPEGGEGPRAEGPRAAGERLRANSYEQFKKPLSPYANAFLIKMFMLWHAVLAGALEAAPAWLWLAAGGRGGFGAPGAAGAGAVLAGAAAAFLGALRPDYRAAEAEVARSFYSYLHLSFFAVFPIFFLLSALPWLREGGAGGGNDFAWAAAMLSFAMLYYHQVKAWVTLDHINRLENHLSLDEFNNPINLLQLLGKLLGAIILVVAIYTGWSYPASGSAVFAASGVASAAGAVALQQRHHLYTAAAAAAAAAPEGGGGGAAAAAAAVEQAGPHALRGARRRRAPAAGARRGLGPASSSLGGPATGRGQPAAGGQSPARREMEMTVAEV